MYDMAGSEIICHLLQQQGIRTVAGIPGGANLPLYDAIAQCTSIRHVLARHEQGAGFIAQGLARINRRPEVCLATSGPGATNLITAVADAKLDSVPLVCITGQVPGRMIGTDAFQEVDTYGISIPITKHNFLVRSAEELLKVIPAAFRIAASGRPGPVLVDVPKDVQTERVRFSRWPAPGRPTAPPHNDAQQREAAVTLIRQSDHPVLCLGGGIISANAAETARQFAEKIGAPTTHTLMGIGSLPSDHPLCIGMLGMHGAKFTNKILQQCDLLIAVGMRFDDRATGKVTQFCPQAKIVHIDIDPSELDKIKQAHAGIVGDATEVLADLTERIPQQEHSAWLATTAQLRRDHPLEMPGLDDVCSPYGLIRQVAKSVDDDAIITTDVGQHQMWVAQAFPIVGRRRFLTSGGLGTMGFGLPVAIGAALAQPERTVVAFCGDGSLMMNIQELVTAVEQNVNVKIVVMDNNALGLVHQQQDLFYDGRHFASEFQKSVDFSMIARGFGMPACDLGTAADPHRTLRQSLDRRGPCLIRVPIDLCRQVFPMVPPGAANKDQIGERRHVAAIA